VTATDVERAIVSPGGPLDFRRYLVVPNVTWGIGLD